MLNPGRRLRRNTSLTELEYTPHDFAEKLLDLEIKLEECCDIHTIDEIIKLYTSAIDHYESLKDPKHISYHKKLQGFLARKDVKETIKSPNAPRLHRQEPTVRRTRMLSKHTSSLPDLHEVEGVMKEHKSGTINAHHLLQDNLKKQEDFLESRVRERQRIRSNTVNNKENINISQKGSFEKQIENINQIYEDEKNKRIKEVRNLYIGQIEEMKSMANCEILKQVVVEMERSMERDIASVTGKIASEKTQEIEKVRRNRGVTIS